MSNLCQCKMCQTPLRNAAKAALFDEMREALQLLANCFADTILPASESAADILLYQRARNVLKRTNKFTEESRCQNS